MKVLFITPPYHCGVLECAGTWIPLHLVHLAGAVRAAGHTAVIYDAMSRFHGLKEIVRRIREEKPDVVGIGAVTAQSPAALSVVRAAKSVDPRIVTVMGGIHATFEYRHLLETEPMLDLVVCGEAELTIQDLLHALETGSEPSGVAGVVTRNGEGPPRRLVKSLDDLPAAWDALDWPLYQYSIFPGSRLGAVSSSRGCSHTCSFCSQTRFWKKTWRPRSPEAFVEDLAILKTRHAVDTVLIPDEYPTADRRRWERILDLLLVRNLNLTLLMETRAEDIVRDRDLLPTYRRAGIVHIYVGLEATSQGSLDRFGKDLDLSVSKQTIDALDEAGIISETSFILGMPDETPDSIERTYNEAVRFNPDFAHFLTIAPWPYAELYPKVKDRIRTWNYEDYNLVTPVVEPHAMSRDDVMKAILSCYKRFYMQKLKSLVSMQDSYRRQYLLRSMKVMMSSSFLQKFIGGLGPMPRAVEDAMAAAMPEPPPVKAASCPFSFLTKLRTPREPARSVQDE